MLDPIRKLLTEAGKAKQVRGFWDAAAGILSEWTDGARVELSYRGLREMGSAQAGTAGKPGDPFIADYHDAEGRHVSARFEGLAAGFPADALRSGLKIATHLAVMVARRSSLERERRLGTFLVELSRWLLAAPERELLLRYTLQSVTSLVDAQGAYVALRNAGADALRVAATVGQCAEFDGLEIPIGASVTGRVVRTGEALLTDNILNEPEAQPALSPSGTARAAMIAPLRTSSAVAGAVGVVRYARPGGDEPPPFQLVELQYLTAVAAYIAGGLELSEAVSGARAAAERAHAMVDGSPLPMALVSRAGRVLQLNQAGCRLFGIPSEAQALDTHLEALGLSPSEISLHLVLTRAREGAPWHGRVLVTRPSGDRRLCDCTVTGLSGADTAPTRVQMNDLVHDVAEIRKRVMRTESVEFRTGLDNSAPPVLGLGQELQQVVINLVTNAEHVVRGRSPAIIRLTTQSREGWVRLTVEDSGPGVPREIRARIFDPFFTTKGPDEGTGLGLAICQRVVTEVGGKIWLEDSELGGAKFVVEVPAAPEHVEASTIG